MNSDRTLPPGAFAEASRSIEAAETAVSVVLATTQAKATVALLRHVLAVQGVATRLKADVVEELSVEP